MISDTTLLIPDDEFMKMYSNENDLVSSTSVNSIENSLISTQNNVVELTPLIPIIPFGEEKDSTTADLQDHNTSSIILNEDISSSLNIIENAFISTQNNATELIPSTPTIYLHEENEIKTADLQDNDDSSFILTEHNALIEDQVENQSNVSRKRKETQKNRIEGNSYIGYSRSQGNVSHNVERSKRSVKDRCNHNLIKEKTERSFMCAQISEDRRKIICNYFWKNLGTWKEKKAYINGLVCNRGVTRRRTEIEKNKNMKKGEAHDVFLVNDEGRKVRVCRLFFLSTLDLGRDTFSRWLKEDGILIDGDNNNVNTDNINESDTIEPPTKKTKIEKENAVKEWLEILPKVPSHYCRASTSKTYVESTFRSVLHMYGIFKKWCEENEKSCVGRMNFSKILKREKIAIHSPRKDQCDTCCGFKVGTVNKDEYDSHIKKKTEARNAKNAAKESADAEKLVLTMDLQSVLLCPKTLASSMYYKQKLQVHDFTIYELNNGEVNLYVWHEACGGVTSNEFTSCIINYIQNLPKEYKHVVLISDGCNYQNRNKVLASALSNIAREQSLTIEQLFLERGHTMMEADSVHSTLEQYFKPPINSPSGYIARMRLARPKQPYKINVLDYSFFLKYDQVESNLASLRPGKKKGDPTVTDIRQLRYLPSGEIEYQLGYMGDWLSLPQRRKPYTTVIPTQLYKTQIPIAESKYRHLQELKDVIERDHQPFYDSLTFTPDSKKR